MDIVPYYINLESYPYAPRLLLPNICMICHKLSTNMHNPLEDPVGDSLKFLLYFKIAFKWYTYLL